MLPALFGGLLMGAGFVVGEKLAKKYIPILEEKMTELALYCEENLKKQYEDFVDTKNNNDDDWR